MPSSILYLLLLCRFFGSQKENDIVKLYLDYVRKHLNESYLSLPRIFALIRNLRMLSYIKWMLRSFRLRNGLSELSGRMDS